MKAKWRVVPDIAGICKWCVVRGCLVGSRLYTESLARRVAALLNADDSRKRGRK